MELVVTTFDAPLWETMQLVHGTDVFMGMHGAGFTNLLWLRQVRSGHLIVKLKCSKLNFHLRADPAIVGLDLRRKFCMAG